MFNLLFTLTCAITITSSLNAMDSVTLDVSKKSKSDKKRGTSFSPKKYHSLSHDGIGHYNSTPPLEIPPKAQKRSTSLPTITEVQEIEHGFICATRTLNLPLINFYLSGSSFNPNKLKDAMYDNTALHIIAAQKNKFSLSTNEKSIQESKKATAIIHIFLKDYRTDFSIVNKAGSTPRELLNPHTEENAALRKRFFARCSLNMQVNKFAMKIKNAYLHGTISPDVIEGTIQQIIKKSHDIEQAQEQQEDRILPVESRFPEYATIHFIQQMLLFRLELITNQN